MRGLLIFSGWLIGTLLGCAVARADLILPGYKPVRHRLIFEPSPELDAHRVVIAPMAGFSGVREVRAGEPLAFSSKYGSRIYVVPGDLERLPEFDRERFAQWPSVEPPVRSQTMVPVTSIVQTIHTTVRFEGMVDGKPQVRLVREEVLTATGQPATWMRTLRLPIVITVIAAVVLGGFVLRIRRRVADGRHADVEPS